jgi:hypothetical protein
MTAMRRRDLPLPYCIGPNDDGQQQEAKMRTSKYDSMSNEEIKAVPAQEVKDFMRSIRASLDAGQSDKQLSQELSDGERRFLRLIWGQGFRPFKFDVNFDTGDVNLSVDEGATLGEVLSSPLLPDLVEREMKKSLNWRDATPTEIGLKNIVQGLARRRAHKKVN